MNSLIGDRFLKMFLRHSRHLSKVNLAVEGPALTEEDEKKPEGETLEEPKPMEELNQIAVPGNESSPPAEGQ